MPQLPNRSAQDLLLDLTATDLSRCPCCKLGTMVIVAELPKLRSAAYQFFKDYTKLREGVLAFVGDVKAITKELRSIVKNRLKPRDPGGSTSQTHKRHGGGSRSA